MDNKKIGNYITTLRKERNLTQKDLADQLGITDKAISKWERGAGYPDISMLRPLADILGTSVNELLEGEALENVSETEIEIEKQDELANQLTCHELDHALKHAKKIKPVTKNKINIILAAILSISLFISIFTCSIVDIAINHNLTWSLLVIVSCIMSGFLFIPPLLWKGRGILISLCFLTLLILPFLGAIDVIVHSLTGNGGWLWKLGFPICIIWLAFLWLMVFIYKKIKINLWFYISIGAMFSIPVNLLTNYIVDQYLIHNLNTPSESSYFSSFISFLATAGICFTIGLVRKNKVKLNS